MPGITSVKLYLVLNLTESYHISCVDERLRIFRMTITSYYLQFLKF